MRIAIVDTYYPEFVAGHYAAHPELAAAPYAEQHAALMDTCFGTSDAYSRYLTELGHESIDIVADCAQLQGAWSAENGFTARPGLAGRVADRLPPRMKGRLGIRGAHRQAIEQTVMAQIEAHEADVVYFQNIAVFSRKNLKRLRDDGRMLVGQLGTVWEDDAQVRAFDLILTSYPYYVDRYRALGVPTEYFQIGFNDRVLELLRAEGVDADAASERPHGVVFFGGLSDPQHLPRIPILERIAAEFSLEFWGYGAGVLPEESPLRDAYRGEAWGLDLYRTLARSKIVVNIHGPVAAGYANNMRLYEATGCGALLLTEKASNLGDLFEEGEEVLSYDGPDDLMDKIRNCIENEDDRLAVAAAGQARTLRDHGYRKLMGRVAELIEAHRS
jgi:spore maturation protein CgeB